MSRFRVFAVGVASAAFVSAQTGHARAEAVSLTWTPTAGTSFAVAPTSALWQAPSGSTVVAKDFDGGVARTIDFSAWRAAAPGEVLSPTASMLSSDPQFATDLVEGGSDGGSNVFDPESAGFAVSVWVKPTPAAKFPRGDLKPHAISPNIVQKGRLGTPGGYWKISEEMVATTAGARWAPLCTFQSELGELLKVNGSSYGRLVMTDPRVGYTVRCELAAGVATLTVTPDGQAPQTRSLTSVGPFTVANTAAVSVGHKPLTTSATDIYDGLLRDLTIVKDTPVAPSSQTRRIR
jgi:hypothetical protein